MKDYVSKLDRVKAYVKRNYPNCSKEQQKRIINQLFAHEIVGWSTTIAKINGKLTLIK